MSEFATACALTAVTAACLLAFWIAPGGVLELRRLAGGAMQVDTRAAYGPDTVYGLLEEYGMQGRSMFRRMLLADMAFPAIYGATLFTWGDLLASPIACVAGIAAAGFDYGENVFLLLAVRHWQARPRGIARAAGILTTSKMIAFAVSAASLALAAIRA